MEIYDDNYDEYHSDEYACAEEYIDNGIVDIPEFIYGTKPLVVEDLLVDTLVERMLDYIDSNELEYNSEDEYFSENVPAEQLQELKDLLKNWLQKACRTIVPDYDIKIPFKPIYDEVCQDVV